MQKSGAHGENERRLEIPAGSSSRAETVGSACERKHMPFQPSSRKKGYIHAQIRSEIPKPSSEDFLKSAKCNIGRTQRTSGMRGQSKKDRVELLGRDGANSEEYSPDGSTLNPLEKFSTSEAPQLRPVDLVLHVTMNDYLGVCFR